MSLRKKYESNPESFEETPYGEDDEGMFSADDETVLLWKSCLYDDKGYAAAFRKPDDTLVFVDELSG